MEKLTQEDLEAFNKDFQEVLKKHKVNLSIGQQIIVNKNQEPIEEVKE